MTENEREIRHLLAVAHAALVPHTIDNAYWFVRVKRALAKVEADAEAAGQTL